MLETIELEQPETPFRSAFAFKPNLPDRHIEEVLKPEKRVSIVGATAAEKLNEDRFAIDPDGSVVVCDGVGSSKNGYIAAEAAVGFLFERIKNMKIDTTRKDAEQAMVKALNKAQKFIKETKHSSGQYMASTVSAMKLIKEGEKQFAVLTNVGDSPIYRVRDGQLIELTNYHDNLPRQEDRQALGKEIPFEPKVWSFRFRDGDRILVTTNGVRKNDPEMTRMKELIDQIPDPQELAQALAIQLKDKSRDARTVVIVG